MLGSQTLQVAMPRCYFMPTNLHHTLGLAPFRRSGFKKATHDIHNKVQITLESGEAIDIQILVVLNHLDCVKVKTLSPGGYPAPIESHNIEKMTCLDTHRVRINEENLNHTLTVHEKGLHSSF